MHYQIILEVLTVPWINLFISFCIIMYFPILLLDAKLYKFHDILPAYQYIGHKAHHCNAYYPIETRTVRERAWHHLNVNRIEI